MVVAPTTNDLYGLEVAERKSPPATSSRVLPKPAPSLLSTPSQRPEPPVIAVQKAAKVVPEVPKRVRVPPPTDKLVVLAVVLKKLVEVAAVVVLLVMLLKMCAPVQVGVKAWSTVMVFTLLERPVEKVRAFSKSVPAMAAKSEPEAPVFNRDEVMEETARLVVVA